MREILFRGKAINRNPKHEYRTKYKNGDWVYGLVTSTYYSPTVPITMCNTDGVSGIDVDYLTIGQYTGVKDKNGKKIFEGDIVGFICPYGTLKGEVVYNEQEASFCVEYHNNIIELTPYNTINPSIALGFENEYIPMGNCSKYVVLGNIYDDKDTKY